MLILVFKNLRIIEKRIQKMQYVRLTMILSVLLFSNSCTLSRLCSSTNKIDFYEVGFFTEDNKPDQYRRIGTIPDFVKVSDRKDGGSGEKWALSLTEVKIRETAVKDGFNGVILGRFHYDTVLAFSGNIQDNVTTYYQVYIPIIYDPELYQAPLTDLQKNSRYFKRKEKKK